jgi:hypothetical protein
MAGKCTCGMAMAGAEAGGAAGGGTAGTGAAAFAAGAIIEIIRVNSPGPELEAGAMACAAGGGGGTADSTCERRLIRRVTLPASGVEAADAAGACGV